MAAEKGERGAMAMRQNASASLSASERDTEVVSYCAPA